MPRAIDALMDEHRAIERALDALEVFSRRTTGADEDERRTVRSFVEFFRVFADRRHHGKEEDRLFARLAECGMPREAGPIAVMLAEHAIGRQHVAALAAVGDGVGPLDARERERVRRHAGEFAAMLRAHIRKEDDVLYPMAVRLLPPPVMERLAAEFAAFERQVAGEGDDERLRALGAGLGSRFAPDQSAGGRG